MTRNDTVARAVYRALVTSAFVASGLAATPVFSQDQDQPADTATVVVTGSRIARPEIEAPIPIISVDQSALLNQGTNNFADLATQLPQFTPAFGESRTQSTFSGVGASGLNRANLRNLGSLRSLVLVNGRRVPGGTSTTTGVDFNTIPTANIDHIEIQTGGASAVYGADAVTGVINIVTKQDFEGLEFGASYGQASDSDNQHPHAHMLIGGSFSDRGHGLLTLEFDKQGRVSCADRYICAQDFFWANPDTPIRGASAYSGVGLNGRFFTEAGNFTRRDGSFVDGSGNLIPFSVPIDGYNRNQQRDIAIPTTRIMVAAQGDYEVGAGVSAFAEINYGQAEIDSSFEAHPFQSQGAGSLFGGGPGIAGLQATIPLDNPFMPTQLRDAWLAANTAPDDSAGMTWWQRFAFFNNRGATSKRESIRGVFGFRGDFDTIGGFGHDWNWELSHVYGRTDVNLNTEGLVGTDRLYYGLRVEEVPGSPGTYQCTSPEARALGCIPINPFAPYTQEMINYLSVSASANGSSELEDTVAYLSGKVFDVPAGSVQMAVGAEYRTFSGFLDYDEVINNALATGNQIGDVAFIKRGTREGFVEAIVPVVKDLPFAQAISIEGAYRRSNTDGADEYGTWKYGGDWMPVDGLRLRVMRARSVRTPVPGELSGIGQTFGVVRDPCTEVNRVQNATRTANCAADGVPPGYTPEQIVEQSVGGLTGGNPDLQPEVGTTLTYGFVWTPTFVPTLSLTVDRFDLSIEDIITNVDRQTAVNLCYDTPDRLFCDQVTRGAYPSPSVTGPFALRAVNEQLQNVATYDISGFDIQAAYALDVANLLGSSSNLGGVKLSALVTIYDEAELLPLPGEDPLDMLGSAGGNTGDLGQGFIKRQAVFNIGYDIGKISANWHTRYIGRAHMSADAAADGFPDIGSHVYHDLRVSYGFGQGSKVYAGVTNVFDKEPPFFASGTSGTQALDTIPGYYDVFGRQWFGGMSVKF